MDEAMPVLGEIAVDVTYQGNTYALTWYVIQGNGPSLLGRSWFCSVMIQCEHF